MRVLGIDIGGTKTIVGVADQSGSILAHQRIETLGSLGPGRAISAIKSACHDVIAAAGSIELIGIACGGPLDRRAGTILTVPNLPGWDNMPLVEIFSTEFGAPAFVDNDAAAAALGELDYDAGRGLANFVYFTVSTGIGGGIVIDGRIYRGHSGNAAEFGHQKILPDGPRCTCGDRGCLESLASGTSIARIAREALSNDTQTIIRDWISLPEQITCELVARAAAAGDSFASGVWYQAMEHLGLGVSNVVNVLNPEAVIIGGGVSKAGDLLFDPVRKVVLERSMKPLGEDAAVVPAENGDLTGLFGAFALAFHEGGHAQK